MPTLDDQLNELVRDICSLDYIKTKSEMRRRIMEVATVYARSIVPDMLTDDQIDWRIDKAELLGAGFDRCRNEILARIDADAMMAERNKPKQD